MLREPLQPQCWITAGSVQAVEQLNNAASAAGEAVAVAVRTVLLYCQERIACRLFSLLGALWECAVFASWRRAEGGWLSYASRLACAAVFQWLCLYVAVDGRLLPACCAALDAGHLQTLCTSSCSAKRCGCLVLSAASKGLWRGWEQSTRTGGTCRHMDLSHVFCTVASLLTLLAAV